MRQPSDIFLTLRVLCFAAAVPVLMWWPLPTVGQLIEPRGRPRQVEPARVDRVVAIVLAALRLGRPLVRRGCLTRGLTLYYFLRRAGLDVRLCFGIGSVDGDRDVFGDGFDGHCWLVLDDAPFLEARDPQTLYTEMYAFPSPPRAPQTLRFQTLRETM